MHWLNCLWKSTTWLNGRFTLAMDNQHFIFAISDFDKITSALVERKAQAHLKYNNTYIEEIDQPSVDGFIHCSCIIFVIT